MAGAQFIASAGSRLSPGTELTSLRQAGRVLLTRDGGECELDPVHVGLEGALERPVGKADPSDDVRHREADAKGGAPAPVVELHAFDRLAEADAVGEEVVVPVLGVLEGWRLAQMGEVERRSEEHTSELQS